MEENFRKQTQEKYKQLVTDSEKFQVQILAEAEELNERLRKFKEKLSENINRVGNRDVTMK